MEIKHPTSTMFVDLDAIDHNLKTICSHCEISPNKVIAVVKDSGYGVGSYEMVKTLQKQGVSFFAVAAMDEALFLRSKGVNDKIIVLGYASQSDFEIASEQNVTVSLVDPLQFTFLQNIETMPDVHLMVDTGMNRNGLRYDELLDGCFDLQIETVSEHVTGLFTHFYASDQCDQDDTELQRGRFSQCADYLNNRGVRFDVTHSSNSGAILFGTVPEGEYVRPGIALHGGIRKSEYDCFGLREVSALKSTVTSIRKVVPGEGVSYNHLYKPDTQGRIATIPIGYGDGFSRSFTGNCDVLINGKRYPILARVTMDFVLVDVREDNVQIGDVVTLIGTDDTEINSICDLAERINTISYEILCTVGRGSNHIYHRSGVELYSESRIVF